MTFEQVSRPTRADLSCGIVARLGHKLMVPHTITGVAGARPMIRRWLTSF
jgi:hypothetical protein